MKRNAPLYESSAAARPSALSPAPAISSGNLGPKNEVQLDVTKRLMNNDHMPRALKTTIAHHNVAGANGRRKYSGFREDRNSLESSLIKLATKGTLAKAGRKAIAAQRKRKIAVTFKRGDEVIKRHDNGDEEVLEKLPHLAYTLPRGVKIIGRRK
jgi:hypothetical protein